MSPDNEPAAGQKWDGVERRKRPRKRWEIGIRRETDLGSIAAILGILGVFGGLVGTYKDMQSEQRALRSEIQEIRCELRYLRAKADGLVPPPCQQ